mmetsp:Transcript_84766/g.240112  ORF Transcript_84766/g.240112 Transcript_84766/m.240112 type:complete len:320 (-) Transcript_84766:1461-2420(-)
MPCAVTRVLPREPPMLESRTPATWLRTGSCGGKPLPVPEPVSLETSKGNSLARSWWLPETPGVIFSPQTSCSAWTLALPPTKYSWPPSLTYSNRALVCSPATVLLSTRPGKTTHAGMKVRAASLAQSSSARSTPRRARPCDARSASRLSLSAPLRRIAASRTSQHSLLLASWNTGHAFGSSRVVWPKEFRLPVAAERTAPASMRSSTRPHWGNVALVARRSRVQLRQPSPAQGCTALPSRGTALSRHRLARVSISQNHTFFHACSPITGSDQLKTTVPSLCCHDIAGSSEGGAQARDAPAPLPAALGCPPPVPSASALG